MSKYQIQTIHKLHILIDYYIPCLTLCTGQKLQRIYTVVQEILIPKNLSQKTCLSRSISITCYYSLLPHPSTHLSLSLSFSLFQHTRKHTETVHRQGKFNPLYIYKCFKNTNHWHQYQSLHYEKIQ